MSHYKNCKQAGEVIEALLKRDKRVELDFLYLTIFRAYGFGNLFVDRYIKKLKSCCLVEVIDDVVIWNDKLANKAEVRADVS